MHCTLLILLGVIGRVDPFCIQANGISSLKDVRKPIWLSVIPVGATIRSGFAWRTGGAVESADLASQAYEWAINLGAPAALVAGATIATLYDNFRQGAVEIRRDDSTYIRYAKKATNMLLVSAFALQIVSIFVTTVTGTMLLSIDVSGLHTSVATPLGFLREHFEFEYLTARIAFLQGLLNWLAGVAMEHTIPRAGEGQASLYMDRFVSSSLFTLIILLMSFYNSHLTFYENYTEMVVRWFHVAIKRYLWVWPPRPLLFLYFPGLVVSFYTGIRALLPTSRQESKDKSDKRIEKR